MTKGSKHTVKPRSGNGEVAVEEEAEKTVEVRAEKKAEVDAEEEAEECAEPWNC